jgi:hypothetical protein
MSGSLRGAARSFMGRLQSASQHTQKRFAGDLPVKPNKYVEDMAYRREHIENEFTWSAKNLTNIAVFAFLVPYMVYTVRCVVALL